MVRCGMDCRCGEEPGITKPTTGAGTSPGITKRTAGVGMSLGITKRTAGGRLNLQDGSAMELSRQGRSLEENQERWREHSEHEMSEGERLRSRIGK